MILGISFKKIEGHAKKLEKIPGDLTVNSAPTIKGLEMKDVDVLGLKNVIVVDFEFETVYEPGIGSISIGGELLYKSENNKEIMDEWKKSKHLPNNVAVPIINGIFARCLLKVMNMAEDLQLPPPIRFPAVSPAEQKETKKK